MRQRTGFGAHKNFWRGAPTAVALVNQSINQSIKPQIMSRQRIILPSFAIFIQERAREYKLDNSLFSGCSLCMPYGYVALPAMPCQSMSDVFRRCEASPGQCAPVWLCNWHRGIFNACWRESVRPLLFFCSCLPWIIYQPTVLYWKKCLDLYSDNMLLQTFSRCCYDNIASLCDVYKFTSKNLIDIPKHCVCEKLFWTEFAQSRILW